MTSERIFDWKASFRPRNLLWFAIEFVVAVALILAIIFFAGDSLTRVWWILPCILLPYHFAFGYLGQRWGFVDAAPSRDRIGRR